MCEKEHKTHNSIFFGDIIIYKENYIKELLDFRKNIDKFQEDLNSIINLLMNISESINNYYKISEDIIKNYNIDKLNYNILMNYDAFFEHNKILYESINQIIGTKDLNKKFEIINNLFNKTENEALIENLILDKTVKMNDDIATIIPLSNKTDIAVCLTNGELCVYDIKTYEKKLDANITNKTILDIVEFENNKIFISCWDNIIRFIQFFNNNTQYTIIQELKGHNRYINCLKKSLLFKDPIILYSSSNDGRILLWKYDKRKQLFNKISQFNIYEIEHMNKDEDFQVEGLEESIQYKKLIGAASFKNCIYFCDLTNFSSIEKINVSVNRCIRALKIISNDILLVAGNKEINVLNIKNKSIFYSICINKSCEFNCIFQKRNGNILISEFSRYENFSKIKEFQFDKKSLALNLVSSRDSDFKNYIFK